MACLNPDGSLTNTAKSILKTLQTPLTPEEVSDKINQPLFKVRGSLREMEGAGFVTIERDAYLISEKGRKKLED